MPKLFFKSCMFYKTRTVYTFDLGLSLVVRAPDCRNFFLPFTFFIDSNICFLKSLSILSWRRRPDVVKFRGGLSVLKSIKKRKSARLKKALRKPPSTKSLLSYLQPKQVSLIPLSQCWGAEQFFSDSDPVFQTKSDSAPEPNPNAFGFGFESKLTLKTKSN